MCGGPCGELLGHVCHHQVRCSEVQPTVVDVGVSVNFWMTEEWDVWTEVCMCVCVCLSLREGDH